MDNITSQGRNLGGAWAGSHSAAFPERTSATAGEEKVPVEDEFEDCYLGQFIPLHYHHNMLMDARRMEGFKAGIDAAVFPGAKVLELGGGTGVLSWFAAQKAKKVWCVEFNPDLVNESRRLLSQNREGHKVEVVHADAFLYLPPEPVDVVICEMIHVGMLREKQLQVIEAFKKRYRARFGDKLPVFVPEASIMAVQPLQQEYHFNGFYAPIVQFQEPFFLAPGSVELADPAVYCVLDFNQDAGEVIDWTGEFVVDRAARVNALRFIMKNILAVLLKQGTTIDWLNHYMVLPLPEPVSVEAGDVLRVSFRYRAGGSISSLLRTLHAERVQGEGHGSVTRCDAAM